MSDLRRVLLLGDSIRASYQPLVAELLKGKAFVAGPEENCQFSAYTLASLDRWLATLGKPDIVHWNNGLHDVGHNPNRAPRQYSIDIYCANLAFILARLRGTGAQVIWATTTPVHPTRPFVTTAWSWRNEEIDCYNAAALAIMNSENVPVNDLHAVVAANPDLYLREDKLHLSEDGKRNCAEAVAGAVAQFL
jgi:isoamyl acetate esterase